MFKKLLLIAIAAVALYAGYCQVAPYITNFLNHPTDSGRMQVQVRAVAPAPTPGHNTSLEDHPIRHAGSLDDPPHL